MVYLPGNKAPWAVVNNNNKNDLDGYPKTKWLNFVTKNERKKCKIRKI